MMGHTPASTAPAVPSHTPVQIVCTACAEGDHEQVLSAERCACPCHGVRAKADEVAA